VLLLVLLLLWVLVLLLLWVLVLLLLRGRIVMRLLWRGQRVLLLVLWLQKHVYCDGYCSG